MRPSGWTIDAVWFGLLASLLLHALAVPAVIQLSRETEARDENDSQTVEEPALSDDQLRLGLEHSNHATINWIGFPDPTPHKALPSDIEQAALSMSPVGVPSEAPRSSTPAEPTREQAEPTPEQVEPTPLVEVESAAEPPSESPEQADVPSPTTDDPWRLADETERFDTEFLPAPSAEKPVEDTPPETAEEAETEPTEQVPPDKKPAPETPASPSATGGPSGADDLPGLPSDRESPPIALEMAMTLDDWGKPAAGEGIEVIPKRPRWGPTVSSLAWPRNPTVIIEFGRDGFVRKASFARHGKKLMNTGTAEVDRVLINTLYNWRAKGEKIDSLAEAGPGSLLSIRMFIKLRW